jgi:5-azacytidine-induced protein 1
LTEQKEELEAIIERHLKFIDKLLQDKKALNERCEEMVKKLQVYEGKNSDIVAKIRQEHQMEVK